MRLLVDNCFSRRFAARLSAAGHDVVWTGTMGEDPGDLGVLEWAFREQRVLVTRDKDFGALIIQHRHAHSGLIRVVELSTRQSLEAVLAAAGTYGEELEAGAIVVADPKRMRIRFDDHDE